MALVRLDLQIENTVNDQCTGFSLADATGEFPAVRNGYGGASMIIHDDVTGLVVVVRNETTGLYFTYTFVIQLQVTQSATLSVQGGTPVDISATSSALSFPFIKDVSEYDLWADQGVTLPEFVDGVYQVEYTITGNSTQGGAAEDFDYTTSETFIVDCETACCITKMLASLDPDCSCADKKMAQAMEAKTWLDSARMASEYGETEKAVAALLKAKSMCDCDCGCN